MRDVRLHPKLLYCLYVFDGFLCFYHYGPLNSYYGAYDVWKRSTSFEWMVCYICTYILLIIFWLIVQLVLLYVSCFPVLSDQSLYWNIFMCKKKITEWKIRIFIFWKIKELFGSLVKLLQCFSCTLWPHINDYQILSCLWSSKEILANLLSSHYWMESNLQYAYKFFL